MYLEIISPEAKLFSGTVTSVTVPGVDGEFQMLNHHAAIISILTKGDIKIAADSFEFSKEAEGKFFLGDDKKYHLSIESGTLEMNDNKINILVE
ncbi:MULTISPECIES: FoF1 ATP synthase subunit delta/epsilon [Flavobacterium]|jgi:F-type H+-transporting ATPase subunit epsilon|uniref:F-type H+-transporting ATPase subunit epsilon n=1 Tax=Flavobacterium lindanitolerans TaxID=428988 RepID=A0A497VC28_9FLAO|nr:MULTISPECIES: F0F1 ATP synthase subunit epsilon [Flavobacterium]MBU7570984.1 F0F1 ATP synthase subunit epsilon [Flavobacterium sp.]PZO33080.1 MAG: F0F1 ATP synthase subunit epsilon [Flavobacteriaceae bacterium]THD33098.1 MAG: F0F1 ATP synthase subunit epsilon [Flavobacterium johnsoniae]KQS46372.1 ATP synthase subunit delta [Flavobacterium sp. Leaf359]MBL7868416.1 F0F1 ATP synthase subunit epsilon [Flavobacterium lindanitolerans]